MDDEPPPPLPDARAADGLVAGRGAKVLCVFLCAFAVPGIALWWAAPVFGEMFGSFGNELPWLTQFLLDCYRVFVLVSVLLAGVGVAAVCGGWTNRSATRYCAVALVAVVVLDIVCGVAFSLPVLLLSQVVGGAP